MDPTLTLSLILAGIFVLVGVGAAISSDEDSTTQTVAPPSPESAGTSVAEDLLNTNEAIAADRTPDIMQELFNEILAGRVHLGTLQRYMSTTLVLCMQDVANNTVSQEFHEQLSGRFSKDLAAKLITSTSGVLAETRTTMIIVVALNSLVKYQVDHGGIICLGEFSSYLTTMVYAAQVHLQQIIQSRNTSRIIVNGLMSRSVLSALVRATNKHGMGNKIVLLN